MRVIPPRRPDQEVSCQRLVELVTAYFDNALSATDRDAVERHLARCDDCDGYVAQVRRLLELTRGAGVQPADPAFLARLVADFRRR